MSVTALNDYKSKIEEFTRELLEPYTTRISALPVQKRASKELNDPVWGTISLSAAEVFVLDSPLLQRLRRIRQLGVAHWVYPGTNHTRIEHSIGVCHQVGRVIESVLRHAKETETDGQLQPLAEMTDTLRLAGLCHDVGHGLFSHAIENALALNVRINRLRSEFGSTFDRAEPQLSEMAAFYMVGSPAFAEMLNEIRSVCQLAPSPTMAAQAARVIAGLDVAPNMPLLHELISGPFDADKMDYMKRDALMCGIPVVTDIERLVQKTRGVASALEQLPRRIKSQVKADAGPFVILGVARSGARAIDELALARTLMFDKVYRHQKVRAVEAMVSSIIALVGPALCPEPEMLPLTNYDDDFLQLDVAQLAQGQNPEPATLAAAELIRRMRERELFVRAIAFTQRSPFDELADSDERRLHNANFSNWVKRPGGREEFLNKLAAEVTTIADLADRQADLHALPGEVRSYLWVDPPRSEGVAQPAPEVHALLISGDRQMIEVSRSNPDLRGWTDAYSNTRDVGYVFSPKEIADIVYVAAEIVMRRDHQVRVPDGLRAYAKTDSNAILALKSVLVEAGYYTGVLQALGPDPEVLTQGDIDDRLGAIRNRLQGYLGPSRGDEAERSEDEPSAFHGAAVLEWVKQYPAQLVAPALRVVEGVRMISRDDVSAAVRGYMHSTGMTTAVVAPLGDPKDGASVIAYYAGDLQDEGVRVDSVQSALSAEEALIIVDDFIGLGSSSISILEKLLGEEPTTSLNEQRVTTLNEDVRAAFLNREVHFVFVYGFASGTERLSERAKELGIQALVNVAHPESDIPTVEKVLENDPLREAFINESTRIGDQLIGGDDSVKRVSRAFGYGNRGVLLISPFNTPTVTLTTLWRPGEVDGQPWTALFPRRTKR